MNTSDRERVRLARVGLSRIVEPTDRAAAVLVRAVGPETLLREILTHERLPGTLATAFARYAPELTGRAVRSDLDRRYQAWRARVPIPDPAQDLRHAHTIGAWAAIPEDPDWPAGLADLGLSEPLVLWGRGNRELVGGLERSVAVVGSRNASPYGVSVTRAITTDLAGAGWCVVSGGAYGIDAVAHETALEVGSGHPVTVAVFACGVDRFYPQANARLLERVAARGLVMGEVPLGSAPTRYRFLHRNRLIAALSSATVVTEAAWRSGSLNTAHHAAGLSRDVAAVPGDVLAGRSAGCHKLIRDGSAVLVNDGADVLDLLGPLGNDALLAGQSRADDAARRPEDGLDPQLLRLYDALPLRSDTDPGSLARVSGLRIPDVLSGLARLREAGLAEDSLLGWRRTRGTNSGRGTGPGSGDR